MEGRRTVLSRRGRVHQGQTLDDEVGDVLDVKGHGVLRAGSHIAGSHVVDDAIGMATGIGGPPLDHLQQIAGLDRLEGGSGEDAAKTVTVRHGDDSQVSLIRPSAVDEKLIETERRRRRARGDHRGFDIIPTPITSDRRDTSFFNPSQVRRRPTRQG